MSYFDPRRMPVLPAGRREAIRHQLEEVVVRSRRSPRRNKPVLIAAGAAVVVLSTGAAAAAVGAFQPVTNKSHARCYTMADVAAGHYTTIAAAGKPGSAVQVQDALGACAALFRQGFLTVGGPGINRHADGKADHRVPRLVVCTMPDGTASVFPGTAATCARLGLPSAAHTSAGSAH